MMIIINNHYNIFILCYYASLTSVLVVDDARFMRIMLKDTLVSIPCVNVLEANDSSSAIEMYKKEKPDLVTMDINLPGTDGISCMKNILKINPQAKILMISGMDQKHVIDNAMNSGAQGYIKKPFNKIEVISKVKTILDEYS